MGLQWRAGSPGKRWAGTIQHAEQQSQDTEGIATAKSLEGLRQTRAAWKGLQDGEEAQHLHVQRLVQGKVHICWKVTKVDQLYPKYHLSLLVSFPQCTQLQVLN